MLRMPYVIYHWKMRHIVHKFNNLLRGLKTFADRRHIGRTRGGGIVSRLNLT